MIYLFYPKNILVFFLTVLLIFISYTLFSQRIEEERKVGVFRGIKVSHGISISMKQGNSNSLFLEGKRELLHDVITEVRSGTLYIYFQGWDWDVFKNLANKEVFVRLTYTSLDYLNASEKSFVECESILKGDDMRIEISSGSDIIAEVRVDYLKIYASYGATIKISGKSKNVYIKASSASHVSGFNLISQKAELESSSGSDIKITVQDEISAEASTLSDILYKGSPTKVFLHESSGGEIYRKNE
ncbi:MAG: head GIN domain-containing protein [Chitinophagaceae bacterium]|nr:head GIN domain-containing protein [Chitinophagaceae bacterium]